MNFGFLYCSQVFVPVGERELEEPRSRNESLLVLVLQQKKILDYSTRNRKFKRLEPHFRPSATRSGMKEETKSAVALAHSRECTKELISGLPNFCSQGTVELEQKNEMSSEKKRRQTCFHWLCCRDFWQYQLFFVVQHRCFRCTGPTSQQLSINFIPRAKPAKVLGNPVLYVTGTVRFKREWTGLGGPWCDDTSPLRFDIRFVANCAC